MTTWGPFLASLGYETVEHVIVSQQVFPVGIIPAFDIGAFDAVIFQHCLSTLVTSAVVANRRWRLQITDVTRAVPLYAVDAGGQQAAGLTQQYFTGWFAALSSPVAPDRVYVPAAVTIVTGAGFIVIQPSAMDPGDQVTVNQVSYFGLRRP